MNWHEKSNNSDLFYCVNNECNVITFRLSNLQNNDCPKCKMSGAIVRTAKLLNLGIRDESPKKQEPNPAA